MTNKILIFTTRQLCYHSAGFFAAQLADALENAGYQCELCEIPEDGIAGEMREQAVQQIIAAKQDAAQPEHCGNSRPKQQPPHFPASLQKKICPCNGKEIHEKILDQKYVCIKYIYFLSPRFFSDMPPIIRCRRLLFCQKSAL